NIKICDSNISGHTHEFEKAAGSIEGDNAVILGGKALALLGLELIQNSAELKKVKESFEKSIRAAGFSEE
ncbi:MAG: hypothetical protein ACRC5W_08855, partial [Cetobacterium sp.]